MRLCYSTLACPNWDLPQIVNGAVAAGVQGIDFRGLGAEIDITKTAAFTKHLEHTLGVLRDKGLEIPCINTSVVLVTPASERWQMMLDEFQRYARLARRCGTKFVRIFGGKAPKELSGEEALPLRGGICGNWSKSPRRRPACRCWKRTMIGAFPRASWKSCTNLIPPRLRAMGYRAFLPPGGKSAGQRQTMQRYLRHVHFKDGIHREGKNIPRLLGEGDVPLGPCMAALRAVGYDAWICLECEKRWLVQETPDPEVSIPQFAHYMREVLGVGQS